MILKDNKITDKVSLLNSNKCGAITCIFNVDNKCYENNCDFHERGLKKEED